MNAEREHKPITKTERGLPVLHPGQGKEVMQVYYTKKRREEIVTLLSQSGLANFINYILKKHPQEHHTPMVNASIAVIIGITSQMPLPDISRDSAKALISELNQENLWEKRIREAHQEMRTETPGLGEIVDSLNDKYPQSNVPIMDATAAVVIMLEHQIAANAIEELVNTPTSSEPEAEQSLLVTKTGLPVLTRDEGRKVMAPFLGPQGYPEWTAYFGQMAKRLQENDPNRNGLGKILSATIKRRSREFEKHMSEGAMAILRGIASRMDIPDISTDSAEALLNELMGKDAWKERIKEVKKRLPLDSPGLHEIVKIVSSAYPEKDYPIIFEGAAAMVIAIEHQLARNKKENDEKE